ncbi:MAG: hypothetical protein QXS68_05240 [Candidatus Methanomethylicaceae archaeon]
MRTVQLIKEADEKRLSRALHGLLTNCYSVEFVESNGSKRAWVRKGEEKKYAVCLGKERVFCSCHDHFQDKNVCKHILMAALLYSVRVEEAIQNNIKKSEERAANSLDAQKAVEELYG